MGLYIQAGGLGWKGRVTGITGVPEIVSAECSVQVSEWVCRHHSPGWHVSVCVPLGSLYLSLGLRIEDIREQSRHKDMESRT
jgi:hypothetical protein